MPREGSQTLSDLRASRSGSHRPASEARAAPPPLGGFFMTTKPERSKCSTSRLAHDRRHHLASVVRPLAPAVAQREGERVGEVFGLGGSEAIGVWHGRTIARVGEQRKNDQRVEFAPCASALLTPLAEQYTSTLGQLMYTKRIA